MESSRCFADIGIGGDVLSYPRISHHYLWSRQCVCEKICVRTDNLSLFPVRPAAIDLSKARNLRDAILRPRSLGVKWITMALQATIPGHRELRKFSIHLRYILTFLDFDVMKQSTDYGEWLDLDRLLVQFWEPRSTRPKVVCTTWDGHPRRDLRGFTACLLPELTKRGIIDLVE